MSIGIVSIKLFYAKEYNINISIIINQIDLLLTRSNYTISIY